jgi:glycerol-3-phosphate acyltransferase PlsY
MLSSLLIAGVAGYLLGAIPFGYLVARSKGVNIFEVGSRNPGATNVRRVLGRGPGNLVFVLDALKGAMAAGWPRAQAAWLAHAHAADEFYVNLDPTPFMVAGLIGAVLGHSFSCFTQFRGGKGVATATGGFLVLFPLGALVSAAVWAVTAALWRYVSLASMVAAVALPLAAWSLHAPPVVLGVCILVTVFVIVRHRTNVTRLLAGTENKIGAQPATPPSP